MRGRGVCRGGRRTAAALLLVGAALLARVPLRSELSADFPHLTPHALAHFLADFSNYPKLYPDIDSWTVEEESGNYTWWRYSVSYSCGVRCAGRMSVWHEAGGAGGGAGAPSHGAATSHRIRVFDARCSHFPLMPLLKFCDEADTETAVVERAGGGTHLVEIARGACGAGQALTGRCDLSARRRHHMDALGLVLS